MISVRRLEVADAALYRALRLEGLEQAPEAFGSTLEREQGMALAAFAERLAERCVLAVFDGGDCLGLAGLIVETMVKERHKGTLFGMYVRPAARRQGAGRALVAGILAVARGQVEQVKLAVVEGNEGARRLYEDCGFVTYGIEPRALKFRGRYFDEVLMVRFLDPAQGGGGNIDRTGMPYPPAA